MISNTKILAKLDRHARNADNFSKIIYQSIVTHSTFVPVFVVKITIRIGPWQQIVFLPPPGNQNFEKRKWFV